MKRYFPRTVLRLCCAVALLILGGMSVQGAGAAGITVTLLAEGNGTFQRPLDASPSPDGTIVYFVARAANDAGGVFRVSASGGTVETVVTGSPLVAPRGLVLSTDGHIIYVADPAAGHHGAVFAVSSNRSSVQIVPGTRGLQPRALDLVRQGTSDVLYVAGVDPKTERAGVWRIDLGAPSSPTSVIRGAPLAVVDGIAVTSGGDMYVAGRTGRGPSTDVVLRLHNGKHRSVVNDVILGSPAGIALTLDEMTLLISSLASDGTSQVLIFDLAAGTTSTFNDVIGVHRNSGGLHRAHHANSFAWADIQRPGHVYRVDP